VRRRPAKPLPNQASACGTRYVPDPVRPGQSLYRVSPNIAPGPDSKVRSPSCSSAPGPRNTTAHGVLL